MTRRTYLLLLLYGSAAGLTADEAAAAASPSVAAFVVQEATAGDLNGDGDSFDRVVHVVYAKTGTVVNLGFAVPNFCSDSGGFVFCLPVAGDTIVAFLVSENAQNRTDLNGDGDIADDVLFVYDATRADVRSTDLAVPRPVIFLSRLLNITVSTPPVVLGDVVMFLVGEEAQGGTDLNDDGDEFDSVIHVIPPNLHKIINAGLAAPPAPSGQSGHDLVAASGKGNFVQVLVGESQQGEDLNGDGDVADVVTMEIQSRSGKTRLAK